MGLFSSLFGPSPAERAAQEAERKRQEEKRAEEARVARFERSWGELERKYTNKTPITATAKSSTKRRGYEQELVFDLDGVTAYMAISKIALGFVQNINDYVGKPITFRIISMSKYEKSVQVSASIILQEKRQQEEHKQEENKKLGITKHSKVWSAHPGVLTLVHCFFHSVPQLGHTIDNAVLVNQLK